MYFGCDFVIISKEQTTSGKMINTISVQTKYKVICELIPTGSSVLDLGCGSGELLKLVKTNKKTRGRGVEINEDNVIKCIEKGLSVFQGDLDEGLKDYQNKSFDYVILNQTLQCVRKPDYVIQEMLRVGEKGVISFPNFAYWRVRSYLFFNGRMPKSGILPYEWYNTPNIHLLTINDFKDFCRERKIRILKEIFINRARVKKDFIHNALPNFYAEEAVFIVQRDISRS